MKSLTCLLSLFGLAVSYPNFRDIIPNGHNVPHPCKVNYMWHGVGHHNPIGGGTRNPFGSDFEKANKVWTKELCNKDSDGDGRTNGQELGDPNCQWTQGQIPDRVTDITHPGVCTSSDGSICSGEDWNWVSCDVEKGLKDCAAINEPETRNLTIRFPETNVPRDETSYFCMIFNLTTDDDYHLVAHEPFIDNQDVMHHILLYGCDIDETIPDEDLNVVKKCGMGARSECTKIIGIWAVGSTGFCVEGPMGIRFGKTGYKQAALEFHWNNPSNIETYKDSSGMTLYYTPKLRPNDAALLTLGQNFIEIPPGSPSHTSVGYCHSNCTRNLITAPINVFWAFNHMHYLGHSMKVEVYRNGILYTEVTNDAIYNYDSPVEYKYSTVIEILPGDELVTTCTYQSLSRQKTTFYGDATSDEMCFAFLFFYPATNMPVTTCLSWKNIDSCDLWIDQEHKNCKWVNFIFNPDNATKAAKKSVLENCQPFKSCTHECKQVLTKLFAEHPCMQGDVYDYIRTMSVNWNNKDMMEFLLGVDSCRVEFALVGNTIEDTSGASRFVFNPYIWFAVVASIFKVSCKVSLF